MELSDYREGLDLWLDTHASDLAPRKTTADPLLDEVAQLKRVRQALWHSGWSRWGWPESAGGLGGSTLLRAYLAEVLMARRLVAGNAYSLSEFLAPTLINFASEDLVSTFVPQLLKGETMWCQGFSEPDTGSNLASLRCRAVRQGDGWLVNGQKVWTSYAQFAQHGVLLARTGAPDSVHEGISAFLIDMHWQGLTVRPIKTMDATEEFCEVFFEDAFVPAGRIIGREGQGWEIAMSLLPLERSTALWQRGAYVQGELERFVETVPEGLVDAGTLGKVAEQLFALRSRSRRTQHRSATGGSLGPETSVDKLMLIEVEQALFDMVLDGMADEILLGDDHVSQKWRSEFLYSRASSIYGGSMEIQRNILARRVLELGREH